jgi:hypothetical protein
MPRRSWILRATCGDVWSLVLTFTSPSSPGRNHVSANHVSTNPAHTPRSHYQEARIRAAPFIEPPILDGPFQAAAAQGAGPPPLPNQAIFIRAPNPAIRTRNRLAGPGGERGVIRAETAGVDGVTNANGSATRSGATRSATPGALPHATSQIPFGSRCISGSNCRLIRQV